MESSHICNQQFAIWIYFAYEQYRDNKGTERFIIKLRMDICKINTCNHRTFELVINSLHFCPFTSTHWKSSAIFKNWLGPRRSLLRYAGEASPVKWSNKPDHQRSSGATSVSRLGKWRLAIVYICLCRLR